MKHIMLILLALPVIAHAAGEDQVQIGCDLAKAQAEVQAATLAAPAAFAQAGNQLSQKSIEVGVSQSVSGIIRAHEMRASADAQCEAFRASTSLDAYSSWAMQDIQKRGAIASLRVLNEAVDLAEANIRILSDQAEKNVVTVADVNSAAWMLATLQKEKAVALGIVATVIPPLDYSDITKLTANYRESESRSLQLNSQASANSGWDVVVAVGENKPVGGQPTGTNISTQPFITAQIKYSFGSSAASRAARDVGKDSALLTDSSQSGYVKQISRNREQLTAEIVAEQSNIASFTQSIDSLQRIRAPLESTDSTLALNARRTIDIQMKEIEAGLDGAKIRLSASQDLLSKMP